MPGRLSISPCMDSDCKAFWTVTGLAWNSVTNERVDGSRVPGVELSIILFSFSTICELLSLFMYRHDSATVKIRPAIPLGVSRGYLWGIIGVVAFSFTVPMTTTAVQGLPPLFVGVGRSMIAAVFAGIALTATRQKLPDARQLLRLVIVALGIVLGFPLLSTYALTVVPASHGAVVIALLPAATALAAVWRSREKPGRKFWIAMCLGASCALLFASLQAGAIGRLSGPDLLLFGAVVAAAIGYAEGGMLSRELGSWQTVSWALVLAFPVTTVLSLWSTGFQLPQAEPLQWAAFGYLALVSMFLGFFAWYRGLAIGPMAQVSQTQLVQPVLTILWAVIFLGESLTWPTVLGGLAVILAAATAVRSRNSVGAAGRSGK